MLHGKRREAMRMEMGGHIQRREERRAEGKLKKARVNMDLSCFIDAEGVLQSDLVQGHIKLTQDFAAWYKTPLGHVDNEALFHQAMGNDLSREAGVYEQLSRNIHTE